MVNRLEPILIIKRFAVRGENEWNESSQCDHQSDKKKSNHIIIGAWNLRASIWTTQTRKEETRLGNTIDIIILVLMAIGAFIHLFAVQTIHTKSLCLSMSLSLCNFLCSKKESAHVVCMCYVRMVCYNIMYVYPFWCVIISEKVQKTNTRRTKMCSSSSEYIYIYINRIQVHWQGHVKFSENVWIECDALV